MDIAQLLMFGVKEGASDCHLSAGEPPMLRINGDLKRVDLPALTMEDVHAMVYDMMNDGQRKAFEEHHESDFSVDMGEIARFRVNVFLQHRGLGAVFRTIPTSIVPLEQLGLPPIVRQVCDKEKGLILITGPTGSGKSTTLAGMIDHLNNTFEGHIITIEDPIEFVHKTKKCLINQRELGVHTGSFENALRAALREDPDVILVGEMRDLETIRLALTAAETGHLVFGTLHTSSAPKSVDRIIDSFPPNQQAQVRTMLAESLEGVFTQTLVKKRTTGRVPAVEIMLGSTAVRNLIRENKLHQIPGVMQASQRDGMQTLDMALIDLATRGVITKGEAQSKSMTANLFGGVAGGAA